MSLHCCPDELWSWDVVWALIIRYSRRYEKEILHSRTSPARVSHSRLCWWNKAVVLLPLAMTVFLQALLEVWEKTRLRTTICKCTNATSCCYCIDILIFFSWYQYHEQAVLVPPEIFSACSDRPNSTTHRVMPPAWLKSDCRYRFCEMMDVSQRKWSSAKGLRSLTTWLSPQWDDAVWQDVRAAASKLLWRTGSRLRQTCYITDSLGGFCTSRCTWMSTRGSGHKHD